MTKCLLCLQLISDMEKCIQVESSDWKEFNIKKLIDKHLWPIDNIKENSLLCSPCWKELKDFHKFHTRVAKAHNDLKSVLLSESELIGTDNKPLDMQLETLMEPEILIGHTLATAIVIKQENEETTGIIPTDTESKSQEKLKKQSDSEFHEDNVYGSSDDDSESDDYLPLIHRLRNAKDIKKAVSTTHSKVSAQIIKDSEDEATSETCPDPLQSTDSQRLKNQGFSDSKSNPARKSYYTPKTNRLQHDKFLQEHYKITCSRCHLTFETFLLLCKHFSKEHNERGFATCCEMKFFDRSRLVDHINFHLNPEYFKCKECGKVLTHRRCLRAHMKLHEEKQFQCDVCDKKFVQKTILERHKLTHLSQDEKKHPCSECGKFFANEYVLSLHQRVVHLSIYAKVCELCGQTMPDSNSFKRHMEKHEIKSEIISSTPSTSVKCEECGLILAGPLNLKRHCDLQHPVGGKRDYSCHICPKVSPTLRALKKHIRCAHEMGYDFKCTMCEKAFKRSDNLKAHMSTHTGTPHYRCPWCPKTFNSNGNMHSHRKKAHPVEWEEARRRKYSGNLPPSYKPPAFTENSQYSLLPSEDLNQVNVHI